MLLKILFYLLFVFSCTTPTPVSEPLEMMSTQDNIPSPLLRCLGHYSAASNFRYDITIGKQNIQRINAGEASNLVAVIQRVVEAGETGTPVEEKILEDTKATFKSKDGKFEVNFNGGLLSNIPYTLESLENDLLIFNATLTVDDRGQAHQAAVDCFTKQ